MNVIIAYLETMFSAYPQTPRLLDAKAELRTMMEDAYTGYLANGLSENEAVGRVITEFGNLDELAPVLGITGELAPAAHDSDSASASASAAAPQAPAYPPITMDEATGYAEAQRRIRFRVAASVALFVLSPAPLIVLSGAAGSSETGLNSGVASAIGLGLLLLIVAGGIMTILSTSRDLAPFARVRDGRFSPEPSVSTWAEALAQQHEQRRIGALQVAILFWILSPAPVIALSMLTEHSPQNGLWSTVGVAGTLLFVAAGLLILLPAAWAQSTAERLGSTSSRRRRYRDEDHGLIGIVARIYWPLVTAGFLAWSFIGDAWGRSWIIWPIAGVLFGAIVGALGAWKSAQANRR
ncbi:MAG: hypothetical protein J0H64_09160 [Actinobacteria bacterium]|nr:hypothetical protein [Actinomycetota bacterium]